MRREAKRWLQSAAVMMAAALLHSTAAFAGTGGGDMPWNKPFQTILDNLTGPTGKVLAGLMIAIGGIIWGFTRHEEGAKRIAQAIVGMGLVVGAANLVTTLGFEGCLF